MTQLARAQLHEQLFLQMIRAAGHERDSAAREASAILLAAIRACQTTRGPVWTRRRLVMLASAMNVPAPN